MLGRLGGHREDLTGRRILVTGGSSGIGLTVAETLGRHGARVVLLARGRDALLDASSRVPGCAGCVVAEVGDPDAVTAAMAEAVALLGGLDVVVAAAGAGAFGPFAEMEPEDYTQTVTTTLLGVMHTTRAALRVLEDDGSLVIVGSVAGRLPVPWLAAYAAAKHGVRGFLRSLDAELRAERRPVSLGLIAPGPVDTPFWARARTPDRRLPPELHGAYPPEDVAAEVLRAIARPGRLERTVGGTLAVAARLDSLAPNLVLAPLGVAARLGWRAREDRPASPPDGLSHPAREAESSGGLSRRPSTLRHLRDLIDAVLP